MAQFEIPTLANQSHPSGNSYMLDESKDWRIQMDMTSRAGREIAEKIRKEIEGLKGMRSLNKKMLSISFLRLLMMSGISANAWVQHWRKLFERMRGALEAYQRSSGNA